MFRYLAPGLALISLGIPLILSRVPRNQWYGVRTQRTMNGTEAEWYAANRKGGFVLLALGLAILVGTGIYYAIQL